MRASVLYTSMATVLVGLLVGGGCKSRHREQLIRVDGSSTVYPITERLAESFEVEGESEARVAVAVSGTGGGFQKLCRGEVDLIGASRPVQPAEAEACDEAGIAYVELPIALDGIVVAVNPDNDWVETLTVADLRRIWAPEAQDHVMHWRDVRPDWPDAELHLFGPGVDSGTFDYFTRAIVGEEGSSRGDYTSSENDNVLVEGVASDRNALGFFGYAYYAASRSRLRAVPLDPGDGAAVAPTLQTIADQTYQPLSRPVFLYVAAGRMARPELAQFTAYYVAHVGGVVRSVGFAPLTADVYEQVTARLSARRLGSVFHGEGSTVGVSVGELWSLEQQ